ncbi:MAG: LysR family transcriptional regulator [Parvularculaceae bacterium]
MDPRRFDWDHLQAFLAVARTGRLTAAAARLATDHATVSRKITSLEESLRTRLFDRSPRGYSLNAQGEKLQSLAEDMERLALAAAEKVGGADEALTGSVRIGAPEGFGSYFLAPRLNRLIDRHPSLRVQLVAAPSVLSLSKREADLVIALSKPAGGRLFARKLLDFELGLFAADSYLQAGPPIRSTDDLIGRRFIGYISDLIYAPELDYIQDIHPQIATAIESSNLVAQLRATLAGAGLCILPAFIARLHPELSPVLPDEIRLTRSLHVIAHEDMRGLERIRIVSEFLAEEARASKDILSLRR